MSEKEQDNFMRTPSKMDGNFMRTPITLDASCDERLTPSAPVDERLQPLLPLIERYRQWLEAGCDASWQLPPCSTFMGSVYPLALDRMGCRLLQDSLDNYTTLERKEIALEFKGRVRAAVESPHANHVIQRLVELLPPKALKFLLQELRKGWGACSMARHKFGCRVLERILEHFTACRETKSELEEFLAGLMAELQVLSRHLFGNFVVQHLVEYGDDAQRTEVCRALRRDLRAAALDEHAVCVLDRALEWLPEDERSALADGVVAMPALLPVMASSRSGELALERLVLVVGAGPRLAQLSAAFESQRTELLNSRGGRTLYELVQKKCNGSV